MKTLEFASYTINVSDEPTYSFGSSDNVRTFSQETHLGGESQQHYSAHGITVSEGEATLSSHLLASSGGPTSVHKNSALVAESSCIVAIGSSVVALTLPSLEVLWIVQADDFTVFGVHTSKEGSFLISHGEMSIARLSFSGTIEWQSSGADIFSEGFSVHGNHVRALDFNKKEYLLDLKSGAVLSSHERT